MGFGALHELGDLRGELLHAIGEVTEAIEQVMICRDHLVPLLHVLLEQRVERGQLPYCKSSAIMGHR